MSGPVAVLSPAVTSPVASAVEPVKGDLQGRQVTNIDIQHNANKGTLKFLKVVAVALIIIGAAVILAGLALGTSLLLKGTALIQYTPYIVVGIAIMGKKGALAATISSVVFGILSVVGGAMLWKYAKTQETIKTITKEKVTVHVVEKPGKPGETKIVEVEKIVTVQVAAPAKPRFIPRNGLGVQNYDGKGLTELAPYVFTIEKDKDGKDAHKTEHLSFCDNKISSLPYEMINLPKLVSLKMAGNQFSNLANVELLIGLEHLDVRDNPLTSISDELASLPALKEIFIDADKVDLLPEAIRKNSNIKIYTDPRTK